MKSIKKYKKELHAIIDNNRVICPHCGSKEEFAPAYSYNGVEYNGKKVIQFFVRCIHKTGGDEQCNCCSTYLLDLVEGKRYAISDDEELKEIIDDEYIEENNISFKEEK